MENIVEKIKKIKQENKFYAPNFSLIFEEYLDIFAVFHSTKRVHEFIKQLASNAIKFAEENKSKDIPSPLQIEPKNDYVLSCDYGFFLQQIIEYIITKGGIIDEKEKEKVRKIIYLYFGVSLTNYKINFSSHVLMKTLFGNINGVTNYKNFMLKGNLFYPLFYVNSLGELYQFNTVYLKKSIFFKAYLEYSMAEKVIEKIKENTKNLVYKIPKDYEDNPKNILFPFKKI